MPKMKKSGVMDETRDQMKKLQDELKQLGKLSPRMSKKEKELLEKRLGETTPYPGVGKIWPKSKPKKPKAPKKSPKNPMKKRNLIYRGKSVLQKRKRSRGV